MPLPLSVLLIEDSEADAFLLQRELRREGFDLTVQRVYTAQKLQQALSEAVWDIVISDYNLPGFDGLYALQMVKSTGLDLPFILISGAVGEEIAVEAMKAGAQDYIKKDNLSRLVPAIQRELREAQVRQERRQVSDLLSESEARYRTLVENIPVGVYRTSASSTGCFLMANSNFLSMLGFSTLEDLTGHSVADIYIDEAERDDFTRNLLDRGSLTAVELQLNRTDGTRIWGSITGRVGYNGSGEPAYFDCILEDITERKHSEALKQALYEISQAANTARDLADLMRTMHTIIGKLMPAKNFYLALYNDQTRYLSYPYFVDEYDAPPEPELLDQSLTSLVIRTGKPLLITPEIFEEMLLKGEIESIGSPSIDWLGVPLKTAEQKTIGALVVQVYDVSYRYTQRDLEVLNFVSSQAAMAIERKRAEDHIQQQGTFLRQVIDTSPNLIFAKDNHGRFTLANQAVAEIYGTSVENLIGKKDANFNANPQEVEAFNRDDNDVIENLLEKFIPEETITGADGQSRWLQTVKRPLIYPGSTEIQVLGVSTDITERKRAEDQLIHNALHDNLTGLPNRVLMLDRLDRAIERSRRHPDALFAILMLDLDRFALINDSLGHSVGDRLLIAAATRLEACLRTADTIARIGGDEFAILLEELDNVGNVTQIADRLLQEMTIPFLLEGQEIVITTSIGIVISSSSYEHPEEVLRDADVALRRAKVMGRGRFAVFSNVMRADILAHLELATDLRQAIERKDMEVFYEPIARLHSGQIHGFEALVRWRHPKRGLVQPAEFIPFAEETGLIIPIGNWVLHQACLQMRAWHQKYPRLKHMNVSVNLSSRQFSQVDLVEQVAQALQDSGLDPRCLRLEITESVIMENAEGAIAALNQLREMGVSVDIDDFGTGYSSLIYLHRLPLNAIKIDRSFISGTQELTNGMEIAKTIVRLANTLKMETVAEGVETPEQLKRMRLMGCNYVQGYLLSHSMSVNDVENYLNNLVHETGSEELDRTGILF